MKTEIWKSHPEYAGIEVSTFGRVRTLGRMESSKKRVRYRKGQVLKQSNDNGGYRQVGVLIDGKRITKTIHRLVAQTFLPNPENLPEVNHKDNDRTNNNVSNLEWCTSSYNRRYQEEFGISSTEARGHPLLAIDLNTMEVSRFRSQHEAGRNLGINVGSINMVIKGKRNQAGGFWFVNDDGHAVDVVKSKLHDVGKTELKI